MNRKFIFGLSTIIVLVLAGYFMYPKLFPSGGMNEGTVKNERKVLYWTDPMIPGDRSDHQGKSPMGMERTPVYADQPEPSSTESAGEKGYYTCPMHPSVHLDHPGACPICGMTLVKKTSGMSGQEHTTPGTIALSPSKQVLANVGTTVVRQMSLRKQIRAVGRIDYAEPSFRRISMRYPGRLDKLYLTYTGQRVKKGDPVADVYSPEAISAQQEYLLAGESYEQARDAPDIVSSNARSLLEQSRQKLLLWGFTPEQITGLDSVKTAKNIVTIYSPITGTVLRKNVDPQQYAAAGDELYDVADLSTVWMHADVYEFEMNSLKIGQPVKATSDAYPGRVFSGTIGFVSPTIDPAARTIQVRAEFPNPHGDLKPEMFVNIDLEVQLSPSLAVPTSAVLSTGNGNTVWVKKDQNVFEPRHVRIGERAREFVQILDGIREGETVVTSGGYLIDSESELHDSSPAASDTQNNMQSNNH